jgi:hypothetical protein
MTHEHTNPASPDAAFGPDSKPCVTPSTDHQDADLASDDNIAPALRSSGYDPEEYRWVPVRRRPRHDGWTDEKQRRFIEVLADTGLVSHAAKSVGMTRESANRLRRSPHAAAFSRAWDAARDHAGSALEDIVFERAIEGVEHNVYNECGEVICAKRVYNDRLLTFLLGHLKPERYGRKTSSVENPAPSTPALTPTAETLDASLRAMEPQLPAPPETILGAEEFEDALVLADAADGTLPQFLSEQRPAKTAEQIKMEAIKAQIARADAVMDRLTNKQPSERGETSFQDMVDLTRAMDPISRNEPPRRCFR